MWCHHIDFGSPLLPLELHGVLSIFVCFATTSPLHQWAFPNIIAIKMTLHSLPSLLIYTWSSHVIDLCWHVGSASCLLLLKLPPMPSIIPCSTLRCIVDLSHAMDFCFSLSLLPCVGSTNLITLLLCSWLAFDLAIYYELFGPIVVGCSSPSVLIPLFHIFGGPYFIDYAFHLAPSMSSLAPSNIVPLCLALSSLTSNSVPSNTCSSIVQYGMHYRGSSHTRWIPLN